MIRIKLASVMVDDQDKAEKFYTEVLGFHKKQDIPMGEARWLTVVSPAESDGTELLLEPMDGVAEAPGFQKALFNAGEHWDHQPRYAGLTSYTFRYRHTPASCLRSQWP